MSTWPVPDLMRDDIYEVTPALLRKMGIRFVLLDVDNTLAPYTVDTAGPALREWVRRLRSAGLRCYILSNNRGERPEKFAAALDLPYRKRAKKPSPRAAREVLAELGFRPAETALIGDQIYTDALCARRCGAKAVVVKPIEFSNFWLRLRYWAELPFRMAYKLK